GPSGRAARSSRPSGRNENLIDGLIDHTAPPVAADDRHDPHRFIHGFYRDSNGTAVEQPADKKIQVHPVDAYSFL
ncbi:MAG: hypothetical protein NTX30_23765, partial [Deltaproteobacteria bacterium]|nr:hypothetical protein [Deltaproteobacteria bacterium]